MTTSTTIDIGGHGLHNTRESGAGEDAATLCQRGDDANAIFPRLPSDAVAGHERG